MDVEGQGEPMSNGADTAPVVGLISQYVKDLSFENPSAPAIYQTPTPPEISVHFDIKADQVADDVHEVTLKVEVKAVTEGKTAFLVELAYAGLFGLRNVPLEAVQPFLLGEGPRLLFPFARQIIAECTRNGGFPPLMLEPIDFGGLYLNQLEARQNGSQPIGNA